MSSLANKIRKWRPVGCSFMLPSCKYCVVIPHRNVPELLRNCLESIPRLPYVHALVVDNSDADKTADLALDGFECGFGGMTVIAREPRNVGYIRNEALRYLREQHFGGKVVFADADDYFTPEATACFEQFKDEDNDVVWFGVEGRDERGNLTSNADSIRRNMSVFVNEGKEGALRYNSGPVWGKFMDMQLIEKNDIWFPEIETCEDTLFSAKVGYYARKPFVCPTPLYVYVQREGSLVMANNARKAQTGCQAAYDTTCWLKERTEDGYYWTQYNVIWHWMNWCQQEGKAWRFFPEVYRLCDKKSALRGVATVLKRKFRAKLRRGRM